MSEIRTNNIISETGLGAVGFSSGLTVGTGVTIGASSGIVTATSFSGSGANITGIPTIGDINTLNANIAILGFKVAVNGTLAKYNLVDQVIDEFTNNSGIDASASTNETLAGGAYSGATQVTPTVTGGTVTTDGNYKVHTFPVGSANFVTDSALTIDYLIVGGGGAGGRAYGGGGGGGAGGAGGQSSNGQGGAGGAGLQNSIRGTALWYAGGGGGNSEGGTGGNGGSGVGGNGQSQSNASGIDGTDGRGGGGGGTDSHGAGDSRGGHGGDGTVIIRRLSTVDGSGGNLTLQSVANTASSAPSKADLVLLIENASGTATLNTDIKGYVSRNNGSNWTQGTLVDEGTWGTNKKILSFHNLDISGQPSGTAMKYKIETLNQSSGSKVTKIHATSLGWK